jgi:hypothetical protein
VRCWPSSGGPTHYAETWHGVARPKKARLRGPFPGGPSRFSQYPEPALLKEIAPGVTRVAVLRDAAIPQGSGQFGAIQSVAPSFGVELRPVDVHDGGRDRARSRGIRAIP